VEIRMGSEKGDAAGGKKISARGRNKTEREEQRRRRRGGFSQGLMRNFRKSQGPFCKAKFHINPKP
jgi:hypothetical protein